MRLVIFQILSRRRAVNICVGGVWVKNSSYVPPSSVSVRRRLVVSSLSQPAALRQKIQKAPLSTSGEARAGQKCPGSVQRLDMFLWSDWLCLTIRVKSHVELGRVIRQPFHMAHFPVRCHGWPVRNFYRSAGFEARSEVRQVQAFNHLNTSD